MKTRLIVITPAQNVAPFVGDDLLHYLAPFDQATEQDSTEYSWNVDTARILAACPDFNVTVDTLDIEFNTPLPFLKGDLFVVLAYPIDALPLYEEQQLIIEGVLNHRVVCTEGVMQLPYEFNGLELQGYAFTVPEITTHVGSLLTWVFASNDDIALDIGHGPL